MLLVDLSYVSPLSLAVTLGRENIVDLLLRNGARPDSQMAPGPLQIAVEQHATQAIVAKLVAHGASLSCLARISHLTIVEDQYQPYHMWLTSLTSLHVQQRANTMPDWVARFTWLQELELRGAQLLYITEELAQLRLLTDLTLTSLAELPRTVFCQMHSLQRLSLSGNLTLLPLPPPNFYTMKAVKLNLPSLLYWPATWRGSLVPPQQTHFSTKKQRKCYVKMRTLVELAASALSGWQPYRARMHFTSVVCVSSQCSRHSVGAPIYAGV